MFESADQLAREIGDLLSAIREAAGARYACLFEPGAIVFESEAKEGAPGWALRRFLEPRLARLFALPASMAGEGPGEDLFEGWDDDAFVLAFLNGRVALALAVPEAEPVRARIERLFEVLADRLFRWKASYRVDAAGRGLFFGRARVDWVVAGRAEAG